MKNIEFKNTLITGNVAEFRAKVSDSIADQIRNVTKCPKDRLKEYLTKDNLFLYSIEIPEDLDIAQLKESIENIANTVDEKTFVNHILKNDSKAPSPEIMHAMMQDEFGLKGNTEWYSALFFVNLGGLLGFPEFVYRTIEEDLESDDCVVLEVKPK